jgi:Ca2+-binding EF-hand superfamily protein
MAGKRRASPEEVAEISRMLNVAQRSVVPPWETPSWFKLFRYVDGDGSGLICYEEFEEMVREVLKLSRSSMPEERLRALWLALDTDSSGQLSAGEVV